MILSLQLIDVIDNLYWNINKYKYVLNNLDIGVITFYIHPSIVNLYRLKFQTLIIIHYKNGFSVKG